MRSLDDAAWVAIIAAIGLALAGLVCGCTGASVRGAGAGGEATGISAVRIVDLRCFDDGSVAAAGVAGKHGVLFQSDDHGQTWHVRYTRGVLDGVVPEFWDDPRKRGSDPGPVYIRKRGDVDWNAAGLARGLLLQDYEWAGPDQWLASADRGRSWVPAVSAVPYLKHQAMFRLSHATRRLDDSGAIGFLAIEPVSFLKVTTFRKQSLLRLVSSRDDGAHWNRSEIPGYMRAYDWFADGHGRIVVFGKPSSDTTEGLAVSVSTDGGATWSMRFSDEDFDTNTFVARGSADGTIVVAGTGGKHPWRKFRVVTSADGGTTWTPQRWMPDGLHDVAQLGPNRFALLTAEGGKRQVRLSVDGGATWALQFAADASTGGQHHGARFLPAHEQTVIAYLDNLAAARSTDGGETWTRVDLGLSAASPAPTASCTDGHGVIVLGAADGSVATSVDDGLTWRSTSLVE